MSTYFVEEGTIDLVVKGVQIGTGGKIPEKEATNIGKKAYELNMQAVVGRYRIDKEEYDDMAQCVEKYQYREPFVGIKINAEMMAYIYNSMECYLYQCSEGKQYEETPIYKMVEKAKQIIKTTWGDMETYYEEAAWGADRNKIVKKENEMAIAQRTRTPCLLEKDPDKCTEEEKAVLLRCGDYITKKPKINKEQGMER